MLFKGKRPLPNGRSEASSNTVSRVDCRDGTSRLRRGGSRILRLFSGRSSDENSQEPIAKSPSPVDERSSSALMRCFPIPPATSCADAAGDLLTPSESPTHAVRMSSGLSPFECGLQEQGQTCKVRAARQEHLDNGLHRSLSTPSVYLNRMLSRRKGGGALDTIRRQPRLAAENGVAAITKTNLPLKSETYLASRPYPVESSPTVRIVTTPLPTPPFTDTPPTSPDSTSPCQRRGLPRHLTPPADIMPIPAQVKTGTDLTHDGTRPSQQSVQVRSCREDENQRRKALMQTVAFTEKVAAVKIFFETQYDSTAFHEVTPRSLRRRKMELGLYISGKPPREIANIRHQFVKDENAHLRKERILKASRLKLDRVALAGYRPLRVLGKGSFGLVRLVQEHEPVQEAYQPSQAATRPTRVFAMKVIHKDEMLRSCQEAHLRAERDFLVSCAGCSKWTIPLRCAFQDTENLYLVMEYAIGGDFLGFLLRKEIISESCAQFYVAEMISCIEEAHNLQWIHRDVKPDNFLIASSGHLKISDFGLAFDGHWAHTQVYYQQHRSTILDKLGIRITGDNEDRIKDAKQASASRSTSQTMEGLWSSGLNRNEELRLMRRRLARSVVGTSQYMAPEVVRGECYDGRCDYWSIGIILFECVYGFTPFCRENRESTKQAILLHAQHFQWPAPSPQPISFYARDLIYKLLQEPWSRISSYKYSCQGSPHQHVYQNDAEDIKRHPFFHGIPWSELRNCTPPFVPKVKSVDSTKYFESEEEILGSSADDLRWAGSLACGGQAGNLDGLNGGKKVQMKANQKRPRCKLLRDPTTAETAMQVRKQRAFLGYTYRRAKTWSLAEQLGG